MTKEQALHAFWASFGWKAYEVSTVPIDVPDKHITYEAATDEFGHTLAQTASLWDRSTSWGDIVNKEREIESAISRGGRLVNYDEGAFWILKGTPWCQRLDEPNDDSVRRIVLNYEIEYLD